MTPSRAADGASAATFPTSSPLPPAPRAGGRGLALRGATLDDLPFLRDLHASSRADEMTAAPWPPTVKRTFLDDQFRLQHHHFTSQSPSGDFLVVEQDDAPIGRLYLDRQTEGWRVLDIALLPEHRGRGHGAALLNWTIAWARRERAPMIDLHVTRMNFRARALYERLGFKLARPDDHPTHQRLVLSLKGRR